MSHPVDIHVGQKLKQLRVVRQMGQGNLGRSLGLSFQQIQKYEAGTNRISASKLYELGQILGVTPDFFFEGLDPNSRPSENEAMDNTVADAFAAIKDDATKKRVLRLIDQVLDTQSTLRE